MSYKAKYIRTSLLKELLVYDETKIRVSADAKSKVYEYLDNKVEEGVKELISRLPVKKKGDKKGELSRITLNLSDFE